MRIIKLTAENYKKLRAVEITPDGHIVQITGRNEQGKTSILECISMAIEGAKEMPDKPINRDAQRARIAVEVGEGERVEFTAEVALATAKDGTTRRELRIFNAAGALQKAPQTFLDALVGRISFNPLKFARMTPREQVEALKALVQIDLDFDQLNALNEADYARRADLNREATTKRAQAEGIAVAAVAPKPVDEAALLEQITGAANTNASITVEEAARSERQRAIDQANRDREAIDASIQENRARVQKLQAEILGLNTKHEDLLQDLRAKVDHANALAAEMEALPALPARVDVTKARADLAAAKTANQAAAQHATNKQRRESLLAEANAAQARADELTAAMAARTQAKADAIAGATMPVPGLGFGDGIVTYEGLPFAQASSAARLRVSLAIAMAANPTLRVIRIDDGSLLDSSSLRMIGEMAAAGDYQVWIEAVDESGQVGIVIEDGAVVSTPKSRDMAQSQAALL